VSTDGVAWARHLIDAGQYVLQSDWGTAQPGSSEQSALLKSHSWQEYAQGTAALRQRGLRRARPALR
jgi:hypothetical protein